MKNISNNKGYTLLFAVLVASLVLAIGLYILSVSRQQFILSETARDSMNAFYAADSGLSCALALKNDIWTVMQADVAGNTWPPSTVILPNQVSDTCNGVSPVIIPTTLLSAPYGDASAANAATTTFFLPIIIDPSFPSGPNGFGGACVWVNLGYYYDAANPPNLLSTIVDVRGYNIGYNNDDNVSYDGGNGTLKTTCSITGPRKVERALRYISN
jgi:hypothetical protein